MADVVIPRALNFSKLSEEAVIMGYFKLILGVWGVTPIVKRDYAKVSIPD